MSKNLTIRKSARGPLTVQKALLRHLDGLPHAIARNVLLEILTDYVIRNRDDNVEAILEIQTLLATKFMRKRRRKDEILQFCRENPEVREFIARHSRTAPTRRPARGALVNNIMEFSEHEYN
jgi:hypothetical protein